VLGLVYAINVLFSFELFGAGQVHKGELGDYIGLLGQLLLEPYVLLIILTPSQIAKYFLLKVFLF